MNFWCILYQIHASNEEHLFIYKVRVAVNSTRKKIVELKKDMLFCNEKDCNSRFFFFNFHSFVDLLTNLYVLFFKTLTQQG